MEKEKGTSVMPRAWDLSDLKADDFARSSRDIERIVRGLENKRGILCNRISSEEFNRILGDLSRLKAASSRLAGYAFLRAAADSSDQHAAALVSKVKMLSSDIDNRLLFISLWFKDCPDGLASRLIKGSGPYRYYLEQVRKARRFTLSEKEERIINLMDMTGPGALTTVYDTLTSQFKYSLKGKEVTQSDLFLLIRSPRQEIREAAYCALISAYREKGDVIGEIYRNLIVSWRDEHITLRKYATPIQVRNIGNDLPDEVVKTLLSVCEKNEHIFRKFFEKKSQRLKLKRFSRFDLYAPVGKEKKDIPYKKAIAMVYDSFGRFSPEFIKHAKTVVMRGHVHAVVKKNKRTGAFCSGIATDVTPYVLLSYAGSLRDVSTLAHELGHAVHYSLSSGQTELTYDAALPLAETASIFSELLLFDNLQDSGAISRQELESLLFAKAEELYASIIRQAGFVTFEIEAHDLLGKGCTIPELNSAYIRGIRRQLAPIPVDDLFQHEWLYIPHIFHSPFYCYAYAFGNLLALSLYSAYKKTGDPAPILRLLSKGGSESPLTMTKEVGVDIASEKFWQGGFDVILKLIEGLDPKC